MPPFLLPILMIVYSVYHNGPHVLHGFKMIFRLWKKVPTSKKLILCASTAVAVLMLISPVAYYGEHIPALSQ
jgi:hypothetical protein